MKKSQGGYGVVEILVLLLIVGLIAVAGWFIYDRQGNKAHKVETKTTQSVEFVSSEKPVANDATEICSEYADLCFTYPSSWEKSSILHGSNFYGETSLDGIEINPPTGTGLYFVKTNESSNTNCKSGDTCKIIVKNLQKLENGNYIISAIFFFSTPGTPASSVVNRYHAFLALLSAEDVQANNLETGKTVEVEAFNPSIHFADNPKVTFLVRPSKGFDEALSNEWLESEEAIQAIQILSSVTKR